MNIITITLDFACLIFCGFLAVIYFNKKNMANLENKIYKYLIILSFTCTTTDLIVWLFVYYFSSQLEIIIVMLRIYYLVLSLWFSFLLYYVIIIATQKSEKQKKFIAEKKILPIIVSISIIIWLIVSIFPFKFIYNEAGFAKFITGTAAIIYSCYIYLCTAAIIIIIILNRKIVEKKKILPIIAGLGIGFIATIGTIFFPEICMMGLITTLISYTMYHTIENPDMQLVSKLELALDQAEKANRAKTDFLSSMSHEIRTPLNAIVGFSECIDSAETLEKAKEDSKDIIMASQSLLEIVNGILDISKIEADKMEIIETDYKPLEIFNELIKLINVKLDDRPIELRTHFNSNLPLNLYGDKGKVRQIIINLLTNAEKYTDSGYIDFDVSCTNENNKCNLKISVSDTGRGMKEEQLSTLFTKFNRLDEDKNTTIEGTGLGLAITKSLVEMMNGQITVESEYGKGSKFTVFIIQKLAHQDFEKEKSIEKHINLKFPGKRVLIVDDNKLNLKVATKLLNEFKFDIECVESGYECIDKVQTTKYNMIFMDIMMPKMDGIETLNKLKELNNFNTPVVALTADAMQGTYTKYIEAGFDDYLSKPIDKELLKKVLDKFLNNSFKEMNEKLTDTNSTNLQNTNTIIEEDFDKFNKIQIEQDNSIYDNQITDKDIEMFNNMSIPTNVNLESSNENNDRQVIINNNGNVNYLKENNVDIDASLELLGDMEMYNETLQTFIEENKARIPRIEKNKQEVNMKDYSVDVHALKSDCKYLGFKTLAELAYNHEMKSKENDINYINEHYNELIDEYNRIKSIIDKYL